MLHSVFYFIKQVEYMSCFYMQNVVNTFAESAELAAYQGFRQVNKGGSNVKKGVILHIN